MKNSDSSLPVPVKESPHWRVTFRPNDYVEEAVTSLGECLRIVERNNVSLRGWDYPHVSQKDSQNNRGSNWVGCWSDFMGHLEYWRFYQSKQFIHLFSVREKTESTWEEKLRSAATFHLKHETDVNMAKVPGFISVINFIYCISEIIEFAARLCQSSVYQEFLKVDVHLIGIKNFVLITGPERMWFDYCAATEDLLGKEWNFPVKDLVGNSAEIAESLVVWFFERFGLMNPPLGMIRSEINDFLKKRS